jgi:hypothetical protein
MEAALLRLLRRLRQAQALRTFGGKLAVGGGLLEKLNYSALNSRTPCSGQIKCTVT